MNVAPFRGSSAIMVDLERDLPKKPSNVFVGVSKVRLLRFEKHLEPVKSTLDHLVEFCHHSEVDGASRLQGDISVNSKAW